MNLKAGYLNRLLQRLKIEMYRLRRKSDNYWYKYDIHWYW